MDRSKKIRILQKALRMTAWLILKKYNPKVIGITGSVGKTSAKEAVFTVLAGKFRVRRNEKNYNNEVGVPLTIIGAESGKGSIFGWLKVFLKGLVVLAFPVEYPKILILEMGADRPGDIKYLVDFVKIDVGVVTEISPSHIEFFKTLEAIAKEKGILAKELDEKSLAIINIDNSQLVKLKNQIKSRLTTFGFSEEAEMRATDVSFNYSEEEIKGISFKLNYKGSSMPVRLNNILAEHQICAALVAAAVGVEFGLNLVEISEALVAFYPTCGRLNLIRGIKGARIIDDTYNASPASVLAALNVLRDIKALRKIAILGDMLELGEETEKEHRSVGKKVFDIKADLFFAFGRRMKFAVEELEKHNFPRENIFYFEDHETLGKKLREEIREGDLILVKGSQSMRMEKAIEEIMYDPTEAEDALCRQSQDWKEKPFRLV